MRPHVMVECTLGGDQIERSCKSGTSPIVWRSRKRIVVVGLPLLEAADVNSVKRWRWSR